MGAWHYLSPELLRCEAAGPKSDGFALGVLFMELLSLRPAKLVGRRGGKADGGLCPGWADAHCGQVGWGSEGGGCC